jgi:aminoglycoside 3-N-acetyltransferase
LKQTLVRRLRTSIAPNLNVARLSRALLALGIAQGDTICVHTSLKYFGRFDGTLQEILNLLDALVGQDGTIAMPAFTFADASPGGSDLPSPFIVSKTPGRVGLLNELFRRRVGTIRSWHPTHSIAARGPLAEWLVGDHLAGPTPFHLQSPFARLDEVRGKIVFLGADPQVHFTHLHVAEDRLGAAFPVAVYQPSPYRAVVIPPDGAARTVSICVHDPKVFRDVNLEPVTAELIANHALRVAYIGPLRLALATAAETTATVMALAQKGITIYHRRHLHRNGAWS